MFSGCYQLEAIDLPENIKKIEANAFYNCDGLKSFSIPSGVTVIGDEAFKHCYNLATIISNPTSAPKVYSETFGYESFVGSNATDRTLYIKKDATGYEDSYWGSVLLNPEKCGFKIEYMD